MKRIPNFPDYYITEDAKVISKRTKNQKELSIGLDNFGYYKVGLINADNKNKSMRIHTLMMLTYGSPPPKDMKNPTIDHINGNKLDNRIENLQWLSNEDNAYKNALTQIKTYIIQCPDGKVITIRNLNNWCRINNFFPSSLRKSYKFNHKHKGYKILKII